MLKIEMLTNRFTAQGSKPNNFSSYQRKEQGELLQKLAHWEAIFQSCQDSILTKDLNGIVTSWNPASEKMYGYTANEIIGQPITILFPPELLKDFPEIMAKLKRGQKIENRDTVRVRKDGKRVYVSISLSPIRNMEGKIIGASGIGHDISERIELEKRKDDFIAIASHELKTPLTSLKGFSQILIHYSDQLDPRLTGYLNKMNDQVDRLNILVSDLLDVSHIKSDKIKLRLETFKIDQLIKEVAQEMQGHTSRHQIILRLKANCVLKADKYRLNQVLVNLITNSIKYSPKADKIIIKSRSTSKFVEVIVEDFGIGLFPKDQKRIFERFYQVKNKIRESFSGLGLGLYISAEIIHQHQGEIEVESRKGVGSTFRFQIPRI